MSALLAEHGLTPLRHLAQGDVGDAATWQRSDSLHPIRLSISAHVIVAGSG